MYEFMCTYVAEQLVIKSARFNGYFTANITLSDGIILEHFNVTKIEDRVFLSVGFDKNKMELLAVNDPLLKARFCEEDVHMKLAAYGTIPVYRLQRPGGTGFLRFNVTDFEHNKACKLVDTMLSWFPHIVRDYDVKRKTALAMAMHRRLGSESLLATLGDILPFVSELM